MKKSKVYRMGAVLVGLALMGISACSDEEVAVSTEAPAISEPLATDAPSTQAPAASGELEGMKVGIRQGPDISNWLAMVSDYWVSLGNAA